MRISARGVVRTHVSGRAVRKTNLDAGGGIVSHVAHVHATSRYITGTTLDVHCWPTITSVVDTLSSVTSYHATCTGALRLRAPKSDA